MPAGVSAARDVSESMLATRFEFATAIVALPPSLGATFLKMDIAHALTPTMLPFIFVFLFMLTFRCDRHVDRSVRASGIHARQ
jgi:hypothetical protein